MSLSIACCQDWIEYSLIYLLLFPSSLYTLCLMDDFKFLANMIEHIKLPLKAKYTFCCAPINRNMPFVCTMYLKIVRQYR